jgi:hypothetical protein
MTMGDVPDPMDDGPDNGPRVYDLKNPFGETPAAAQARRRRSMALAIGLIAFVVIIFIVTMVKLKGNVLAANHL